MFEPATKHIATVITFRKTQFCAALFAAAFMAVAGTAAEPDPFETYKVFLTRNPFGLKDPPPPPKPPEPDLTPEPDLPGELKLTGIRSLKGRIKVLFAHTPAGEETEFLSIYEGERSGPNGIEVLQGEVDIEKGTVRVKIQNFTKTLSFENDGYQGGGAKGGRARPTAGGRNVGVTPRTGGRIPPPPARPLTRPSTTRTSFPRPIRTSSNRTQPIRSTGAIPAPTAGRTVRLNAGGQRTSVNPTPPKQTMSREEQEIVMRATQIHKEQNPDMIEVAPGKFIKVAQPPLPPMTR